MDFIAHYEIIETSLWDRILNSFIFFRPSEHQLDYRVQNVRDFEQAKALAEDIGRRENNFEYHGRARVTLTSLIPA